ncbi:MAG: NADH-quinone oxidoreductase subunit C [Solirubrobacteraceae bacterium]
MPDVEALERLGRLVSAHDEGILVGIEHRPRRAEIQVRADAIVDVLERMRAEGYGMLMSVHGVDYHPEPQRFGVVYELLSMHDQDRIAVKVRVDDGDPRLPSVTPQWPTASFQEREVYDMFGVVFDGHPDLRRILMPEDYIGHPQRRDFPIGGEPVIFTESEPEHPGWWK